MHSNTCKPTHSYKYGVDEEALDVCIKTLGLTSHTQDCAFSRALTKCAGNEERRFWMYIKTQVLLCVNAYSRRHSNWIALTHTLAGSAHRCTHSTHNMNMYSSTFGSEYTAIHADGTYCKAHRHLHTPSIACDRCWQEYCQEESAFISFYSLYFGMPISVHSVAMSLKHFLFSSSSSVHVSFFFSRVIIMKLKSFVPREIRRESGKAKGTLAKIFLSVMS